MLVIGGGVTGAGAALDAASRGLTRRPGRGARPGRRHVQPVQQADPRRAALPGTARASPGARGAAPSAGCCHPARAAPGPAGADPGAAAAPGRAAARVWQRAYYGAGVAAYDAFAGLFGGGARDAAAPAPDPRRRPPAVPRPARRTRSAARSGTTTARSTTPGWWPPWPAPRPASARPWSPAPGSAGFVREAREVDRRPGARPGGPASRVRGARAHGRRGHRRVERRHVADARRRRPVRPGLRVRASKGVHLVVPRSAITGEAGLILRTPDLGAVRDPVGRALDHRHHRHRLAARPGPSGGVRPRHRVPAGPGQRGAGPAAVHRRHRGRLRRGCGRCCPARPSRPRRCPASTPWSSRCSADAGGRRQVHDVPGDGGRCRSTAAVRRLGGAAPPSRTDQLPLLGADGYAAAWRDRPDLARRHGVSVGVVEHLLERYGTLTAATCSP